MGPKKNGNGKGEADILSAILREIQKTNEKLDATNVGLEQGFAAVNARIDQTNARLDNILNITP